MVCLKYVIIGLACSFFGDCDTSKLNILYACWSIVEVVGKRNVRYSTYSPLICW